MTRAWTKAGAAALLLIASAFAFSADQSPEATLDFPGATAAGGIGYTWGKGTLHFRGKDYPFRLNGLSVANVGAEGIRATGDVYHLSKVEEFSGNYTAASAGMTVAGGAGAAAMQNQNGVVIYVKSTTQGFKLNLWRASPSS